MLRLSGRYHDVTLVTGYAPGDHLPRTQRYAFWKSMGTSLAQLPYRTNVLLGIDANGHIGRDGQPPNVGTSGAERWTENGQELAGLCAQYNLNLCNTQPSCLNPGWTWCHPTGKWQTRVDYVAVSSHLFAHIRENTGAIEPDGFLKGGSPTDHRPVDLTVCIPPVVARTKPVKRPRRFTCRDIDLKAAYEAYDQHLKNQFQQDPQPVDEVALQNAHKLQQEVAVALTTLDWTKDHNTQYLQIEQIVQDAMRSVFGRLPQIPPIQPWITRQTLEKLAERSAKWTEVRIAGKHLCMEGWETCLKKFFRKFMLMHPNPEEWGQLDMVHKLILALPPQQPGQQISIGQAHELGRLWLEWDILAKVSRAGVKYDRAQHMEQLFEAAQKAHDPATIWKCIQKVSPKQFRSDVPLKKQDGTWCMSPEEELQEISQHLKSDLYATSDHGSEDNRPEEAMQGSDSEEDTSFEPFLEADVVSAFRHTPVTKATPTDSIPTRAWVILEDQLKTAHCRIWNEMDSLTSYPESWADLQAVWLNKPGKDPAYVHNRRGIYLTKGPPKAYQTALNRRLTVKRQGKWKPHTSGGIKRRGCQQALVAVSELRSRLKKRKKGRAIYLGDATKAFDIIKRASTFRTIRQKLKDRSLPIRLLASLKRVRSVTRTRDSERTLTLRLNEGVPQGGPNGPALFVIGNEGFADLVEEKQRISDIPPALVATLVDPLGRFTKSVDVSRIFIVDDHAEIITPIKSHKEIAPALLNIYEAQTELNIVTNATKSALLLDLPGRGARKRLKAAGTHVHVPGKGDVPVVDCHKYLGTLQTNHGTTSAEVTKRIEAASRAMSRLKTIWRLSHAELDKKLGWYSSLVQSILLYGLETAVLQEGELTRLECTNTRFLRRVAKSPVHLTHETNESFRDKIGASSVATILSLRRLRLIQKALQFPEDNLIVLASMFGTFAFEDHESPTAYTSQRLALLSKDLQHLHARVSATDPETALPALHGIGNGHIQLNRETMQWLHDAPKAHLLKILRAYSPAERSSKKRQGPSINPMFECLTCHKAFPTMQALQTHRWGAHRIRNEYKALVTDQTCPVCKHKFANKAQAEKHISTICGPRTPRATIDALHRLQNLAKSPAGVQPGTDKPSVLRLLVASSTRA